MSASSDPRPYHRCFVSGNDPEATNRLAEMVRSRGIEAASAAEMRVGQTITKEVIRLITDSDFIAVVITDGPQAAVAYELGLAQGLGKPAFVIFASSPSIDLANAYMVAVEDGMHLEGAAEDLDRFVRNAKRPGRTEQAIKSGAVESLDWARKELDELRVLTSPDRYQRFERLCAKVFRATGAEVSEVGQDQTIGADLIVWLNDIAFELGGPTLVECKFYGGGVGSVVKNSEATVRQIEKVMERSDAKLALLVYDHDRKTPPPSLFETPRVLSFALEDLIAAIEHLELESMILKRRERALFAKRAQ
jgi:nucleoside 2-deoxyribosyltransferase